MGCSTCGKNARTAKPGGSPSNPIILGESNDEAAQVVTFTAEYEAGALTVPEGDYRYVSGDGIAAALESGAVVKGFPQRHRRQPRVRQRPKQEARWFVESDAGSYVGFTSNPAARRFANATGKVVLTKAQVLEGSA